MSSMGLCLIVALLFATLSCGFLPPLNTSALVVNRTNYVSACGLNVLTYTVNGRQPYYYDFVLTPVLEGEIQNVAFVAFLAPYGPSTSDTFLNAFDPGCAPYSCRSNSSAGCSISVVCNGDQSKPFFAYVRTTNGAEGLFSIDLVVRPQAQQPILVLNNRDDYRGDAKINIMADIIDTTENPLNAFDFFTFTIPSGADTPIPGSTLEILIYSAEAASVGRYTTYLNFGGVAFPNGGCIAPNGVNRSFLEPCEVAQGGTWGFTVERQIDFQNYSLFAYIMPGSSDELQDNKMSDKRMLRTVNSAAYFKYNVPFYIANDNQTQAQLTFVIENIVGGTLRMDVYPNAEPNNLPCGSFACTSKEGCHIPLQYCQIQPGHYLVVVTAVTVNDPFFPVYFTVLARMRQVGTTAKNAGDKWTGHLMLSEYEHYVVSNPGGHNWLDIELYVDSDSTDIPATMYIGFLPFPNNDDRNRNEFGRVEGLLPQPATRRNEFPVCDRNYNQSFWKRCTADRVNSNGFLRLCFLQLDPCELQRFPNGVYLTVFNNGQNAPLHTWTQNPFYYTVYTRVWSPHDSMNVIKNGFVRTDFVHNELYKAYVIERAQFSNLRITVSGNHQEIAPTSPDSGLVEITYEIVYSYANLGPWCNTCYRSQTGARNVRASDIITFEVPQCIENHRGMDIRNGFYTDEYVYLVIKGFDNRQRTNYTQNRFVVTAKSVPFPQIHYLRENEFSNHLSKDTAFARTEYWLLHFDTYNLYTHILSVRFRAHPRVGRRLRLRLRDPRGFNPFCADDNWLDVTGPNCKENFQVQTFECVPDNVNKGYCALNFQICNLTSLQNYGFGGYYGGVEAFNILNRIFVAEVGFVGDSPQFGAGFHYSGYNDSFNDVGTPVEFGYSLTYDLVPQVPTRVYLDTPFLAELRVQEYVHFEIDIDSGYTGGGYYFIIEAFFDSDNIFMDQTIASATMTMYINDPTVGSLAGDPYQSFGCLCHKNKQSSVISGNKKFVYVVQPCNVLAGTYKFSFYTSAQAFLDGENLITVKATMQEYIRPIEYEKLMDFSLFPTQSVAFKFDIEPQMITANDGSWVDKEARFRLSVDQFRYNATPTFIVANSAGNCECGVSGTVQYQCTTTQDVLGSYDCRLNLGFCQFRVTDPLPNPNSWFVIVTYPPQAQANLNQVVPMSILITRFNVQRTPTPMTITTTSCNYAARAPRLISSFLETQQMQYYSVNFGGNGLFSAYVENITSGDLQVFFGNGYVPSPNPGCADSSIICREGSEGCKLSTTCPVTFVGVKAISRRRNRPTSYKITSCSALNQLLVLGQSVSFNVPEQDIVDTSLDISRLTKANFPMLVIFASVPDPAPVGDYVMTYTLSSCGGCPGAFSRSVNCTGLNCTIAVNVCELPDNYATLLSNVRIASFYASGTGDTRFTLSARSVPIPSATRLTSNDRTEVVTSQNNWLSVTWNLGNEVLSPESGIQTSFLSYSILEGGGESWKYMTFSNGDCPVPLSNVNPITISQCCTERGTYSYAFFHMGVLDVRYEFFPRIITQSRHQILAWPAPTAPATARVNMPAVITNPTVEPTILQEVYATIPLGIPRFSTLIVHTSGATDLQANQVRVFINRNQQAGTGHGGCFASEVSPTLAGGSDGFNATTPFFLCNTDTAGIWVGFENTLDTPQTGAVTLTVAQPIRINIGQSTTFRGDAFRVGVNQQFFFAPRENAWSNRLFKVTITYDSASNTALGMFYANIGSAAGPRGGCQNFIASAPISSDQFEIKIPTCLNYTIPLPLIYFGVVQNSFTAAYTIRVEEEDQLELGNIENTRLTLGSPLTTRNPGNYFFTVGATTNTSVVVVTLSNFEPDNAGTVFNIAIFRDGRCIDYGESFCSINTNFQQVCSSFIPSCELKSGFTYHVVVSGGGGATFTILAALQNLATTPVVYNYTTASYTENIQFYSSSVAPHGFMQYKFSLPSDWTREFLRYGGTMSLSLDTVFCGSVDIFASRGGMTGPGCLRSAARCTAAGCNILSLAECTELFDGTIRHNLDFHFLVRGKAPAEGKPISFRFRIRRTDTYRMDAFRGLEKHLISPLSYFENNAPGCPAIPTTSLRPCCFGSSGTPWYIPRHVYTFSVEGDQMLGINNYHRIHFRLVDDRIATGTMIIFNGFPSFCTSGPIATETAGEVGRCDLTRTRRNCTVNLRTNANCGLYDAHQFFITVEPIGPDALFDTSRLPLPLDPSTYWPVYSVSHTHQPYDVIEVRYSEEPQYFRSTMAMNEVSFYKVRQQQGAPNYHFVVTVQQVIGGRVSLTNSWNECATASCADTDCRNYDAERPCTEFLPDCTCKMELLPCAAGEITGSTQESFFQVTALANTSTTLVEVQLMITFIQPMVTQQPECYALGCGEVRYHDAWRAEINNDQLYRYRIKGVEGRTTMSVRDGLISLPGYPDESHAPGCRQYRRCDARGPELGYRQCEFYHRRPGTSLPYVTINVAPSGTAQCSRALTNFDTLNKNRYNLELDLITPPIVTLVDGNLTDSTYFTGGCQTKNESYYYKFTATRGTYMVVELWSSQGVNRTAEPLQLFVTADHISFHIMGEAPEIGCTTQTGLPNNVLYCRYLLICDYKVGTTYYIQVTDRYSIAANHQNVDRPYYHHKIRVSTMTPNITDLALGSGLNFVLPYDNRQIVAVRIPVSGNTVNAEQDLEVFVKGNANLVHTWLTRSLFGGAPCARASAFNSNSSRLVVPHCHISNQGDTYFAQIIRAEGRDMSGGGSCGNSQVTVHARLSMETNAVNGTFSANTIGGAPTTLRIQRFGRDFGATRFLVKVNLPPLGMNDVVYGRLSNFDHNAGLSLTLFKGNHIDQNKTTYGVACDLGCASGPQAPSTNVAWADKCWHCGIGVHGPIFAYIDVTEQQGSVDALTVDMSVVVTSWTDLTDQFQTMSFPLAEHSLAFYTMVHTREEGTRVEIDVITGVSIEVNVYADNCGLRTLQTQYWCFKGVRCDIPVPKRGNVGSYYRKSARDSPDLDNTYRLVIRGFDSTFQIRQVRGTESCQGVTSTNAPFCSRLSVISGGSFWGFDNHESFLAKDRNAHEFYANLTQAFTCPVTDSCDCPEQTEECRNAIAIYACQSMFNPCDGDGFERGPSYRQCRDVEFYCGRTFVCAGIPRLACNHTFYTNGILSVDRLNFPTNSLDDPENQGFDRRRAGIIAAIVILSVLAVTIAVAVAYVLMSRASSIIDFSSEGELGSYEAL